MNLPFPVFFPLPLLQTLSSLLKKYSAPSKKPEKEKLIMKSRSASRGIYENIVPSRRHIQGLFIVTFFCFLRPQVYKDGNNVCGEEKRTFLALTKIPAEQLQYCNYNNLHFSDV